MRVALHGAVVALAMALSAAAAQAQVWQGNDTGGIIPWSCENEAVAQETAAAYCASHNKFHRITSVYRQYGSYIAFNCLWRPDIARYILPAVPTRSTCIVPAPPRLHPRVRVAY